jgi:hypothetical protein
MNTAHVRLGGFRVALTGPPSDRPAPPNAPCPARRGCGGQQTPERAHRDPYDEPLMWSSTKSGARLARGRAMTQPEAIAYIRAHAPNEIDQNQSTATRITYRTASGSTCVYDGARPRAPHPIPAQATRTETTMAYPDPLDHDPAPAPAPGPVQVSVHRFANLLGTDDAVAARILTDLQLPRGEDR